MELTPILLRARLSAIFERVAAEHGPVEDVVWELIRCDRCGRIHHLVFDGFPEGWTTSGDVEHGFTDLCRACSQ
jgi:hypothetical protein